MAENFAMPRERAPDSSDTWKRSRDPPPRPQAGRNETYARCDEVGEIPPTAVCPPPPAHTELDPLYTRVAKLDDVEVRSWLVKTEPETYSWDDLVKDGVGCWDGVRNVEARNNLRSMVEGDPVLIYHSGKERAIVGVAHVVRTAYRDPSSTRAIWSAVDLQAVIRFVLPVTLATVKDDPYLSSCALAKRARLSVMPLEPDHYAHILALAKTSVPGPPSE